MDDNGYTVVQTRSRSNYLPSEAEVSVAIQRIKTQFVTFGLMEEYVESVARLHTIWQGTTIINARFSNVCTCLSLVFVCQKQCVLQ